jgi:hypothetical protein
MLQYLDEALLIPSVQTVVYVGKNLDAKDDGVYYFQDVDSYQEIGAYPNQKEGTGQVLSLPEKALVNVFALDGLVRELTAASLRSGSGTGAA